MAETVFKEVRYNLGSLMNYVELGEIGLPDIQRPFVWKNAKVRDLFDSMYRGYPVGYLLLWQNGLDEGVRTIGDVETQKPPRLLVVDGQQRLTSLFAVLKHVPIVRGDFTVETISLSFNPLTETFSVADAATIKDPAFLPDISRLWSSETDIFEIVDGYLESLKLVRDLSPEETRKARRSISDLQNILNFPFTALELSATITEEEVGEVFVRINSKGTPLNQADFILTLMSVFWDEGRSALETFARESRAPSTGTASAFNHFIHPSPDQMLRVGVGLGFKRARLQHVYSLLRGKDLDTDEFSDERRVEQFTALEAAQSKALDIQHWHDFLTCIRMAGYRGAKVISSNNNLLFSYVLYLMGRTEFGVEEHDLRRAVARWFFMSSLTGRVTGSPESAMEFDLARFRSIDTADQFLNALHSICDQTLTDDFWEITLPNDLATSASRSPSLFAYYASQVLLDAKALFSDSRVSDLLDPSIQAPRSAVERHHLFPRAMLHREGIKEIRQTNQIANFALVEWGDNVAIADSPPNEYVPLLAEKFSPADLKQIYAWNALPEGWESMAYDEFLVIRRDLMAALIKQGYEKLSGADENEVRASIPVADLVNSGESNEVEFKSTLRLNLHTGDNDKRIETACLKTLAGFLNTSGGKLIIGVTDDGVPIGVDQDGFEDDDRMSLHLVNLVRSRMGADVMTTLHPRFEEFQGRRVMVVEAETASKPIYVNDGGHEAFYIRTGPSTTELTTSEAVEYLNTRFG